RKRLANTNQHRNTAFVFARRFSFRGPLRGPSRSVFFVYFVYFVIFVVMSLSLSELCELCGQTWARMQRDTVRRCMRKVVITVLALALVLAASVAEARVVRLDIERREPVLNGRPFGAAGPYEKLVGKVDFGLDPSLPRNGDLVDLRLGPREA